MLVNLASQTLYLPLHW